MFGRQAHPPPELLVRTFQNAQRKIWGAQAEVHVSAWWCAGRCMCLCVGGMAEVAVSCRVLRVIWSAIYLQ
jgi:hypothetical protein